MLTILVRVKILTDALASVHQSGSAPASDASIVKFNKALGTSVFVIIIL